MTKTEKIINDWKEWITENAIADDETFEALDDCDLIDLEKSQLLNMWKQFQDLEQEYKKEIERLKIVQDQFYSLQHDFIEFNDSLIDEARKMIKKYDSNMNKLVVEAIEFVQKISNKKKSGEIE